MKVLNVLIACEESQTVCKQFRALGHNAFSCDIEPESGGHPEWHRQGDVLPMLNGNISFRTQDGELHNQLGKWDLIIAHPPCTYLSNAGARHLYPGGILNEKRYQKGLQAKDFFMDIFNAKCNHIAVENPIPSKIFGLPKYTQTIQPYEHGHPFKKKTCLWLKNLSLVEPTHIISERESTKKAGNWYNKGGKDRQKNRSKTFSGIARAMATQWSEYLTKEE